MAFNISAFRAKLLGGGARPSLFQVIMTPPSFAGLNVEQFSFMCKATSMPASTIGAIPLMYFGRAIKLGGDRQFDDWPVQVINDETFDLRNAFERWNSAIASHTTNNEALRGLGATSSPNSYTGKALIHQMSKEGKIIKTYEMINIWPPHVGPVGLSWDAANQIEMFDVTFAYDFFNTVDGIA